MHFFHDDTQHLNLSIPGLQQHYRQQDFSPRELITNLLEKSAALSGNPVWITLLSLEQLEPWLTALDNQSPEQLPLYGVPFAIKDNIDLAGVPTTAACPAFSYVPDTSAFVVEQLIRAGAIPLGKTNMDQFATGLVGTRSPWGPCKNALNSEYIAGGSSSGSAIAVAEKRVSFSLGTDTAGSGRVPASLNGIVGLKPSRGLLSNRGVIPACRSLDCVSIFSQSLEDANTVFNITAQFDNGDPYSRRNLYGNGPRYFKPALQGVTVGVPETGQLEFFGNDEARQLFIDSLAQLEQAGARLCTIDFQPFLSTAKLLYEGPWVSERYLAIQELIENNPDALLPVINTIIGAGKNASALDTFRAQYTLQALKQQADTILDTVDAIATPTAGTLYTIKEVEADPIQLNSNLGYYTNFMNLLDCAAVAVPTGSYSNGAGFGVTLFHRALSDKRLLSYGAALYGSALHDSDSKSSLQSPGDTVKVVVCGAHLEGLPLNWQLTERGGRLLEQTRSAPRYQLYALAGGPPFRPGMVRVEEAGVAIDVEVWQLPARHFGSFVAEIPAPLGIGKVELEDGRWESGFICDSWGLAGAENISQFGGWRHYLDREAG